MTAVAERILRFERILTLDPHRPEAEAIAVRGGRVAAVGSLDEVIGVVGRGVPVREIGAVAVPGYRDAHTHLAAGSEELTRLDLRDASDAAEVARRVAGRAAELPVGTWIRGWGWDLGSAPERWPSRAILDTAAPRHPVFLVRVDGHAAWLNGAALDRLGLGSSDGRLVEEAKERAERSIPPLPREARLAALERILATAASLGLTSIDDMIPWDALGLYRELHAGRRLPLRVRVWLPGDRVPKRGEFEADDPHLAIAGIKLFLDGTLGSRTAALLEPYEDDPGSRGTLRFEPDPLRDLVREADAAGWAVAVHAIGDRAVRVALDAFSALPPSSAGRHRIEHAELVDPADLPRFAAAGVIASVQPLHRRLDARWLPARVGAARAKRAVPVRSLLASGAEVIFGTDWPVAPLAPAETLEAACDGGPESVDRTGALRALCAGTLVAGALADLAVADGAMTVVGGEIVPRRVDTLFERRLHSGGIPEGAC